LRLRPYFDTLVSGVDMLGKPDPALFLEVARRLDLPPERCIVVEDAKAGVEAAKRANMKCIAVTTTNPADALAAADIIVDRLDALPEDAFECLLA
jgi:beta-phosphoglucomutase